MGAHGLRIDWQCRACGKQMRTTPSTVRECCSKSCMMRLRAPRYTTPLKPCAACGKQFRPRMSGGCWPVVCSDACRAIRATLAAIAVAAAPLQVEKALRSVVAMAKRLPQMKRARRACVACGGKIPYASGRPREHCDKCSPNHRKTLKRRTARVCKARRRARMKGLLAQRIDPIAVFGRDRWRCKLCGIRTPKAKRGTIDADAPELDHVIPLALGGTHTWGNVQCACRACNGRKGATALGQVGFDFAA